MVVQVFDPDNQGYPIPAIQVAFHPTLNIKAGDPVTFLVRTFNSGAENEIWDFGYGSPTVETQSETVNRISASEGEFAKTIHRFMNPGHYAVSVSRRNEFGYMATGRLHVVVNNK